MEKSTKSCVDGERVTEECRKGGGGGGRSSRKGEYTRQSQSQALGALQLNLASGLYDEFRTVLELFWKFFVGLGGGEMSGGGGGGGGAGCMVDGNDIPQTFHDEEPLPSIFDW